MEQDIVNLLERIVKVLENIDYKINDLQNKAGWIETNVNDMLSRVDEIAGQVKDE